MRHLLLFAGFLATGCHPRFDTVDEACPDRVPGQSKVSAESAAAFRRVSCYRRFERQGSARVDSRIDEAAASHARYFMVNGLPDNGDLISEDPHAQGFTGVDPVARVTVRGFPIGVDETLGFWEGVFPNLTGVSSADLVDALMYSAYTRQGVLQPNWRAGGYGTGGDYAVITILYDFPASTNIYRPVFWPRDGQTDVPTSWYNPYDDGVVPADETVGYPISFTVGSDDPSSRISDANPYDLVLLDAELADADGNAVTYWSVTPDNTPYDLPYTLAVVPQHPLDPDTTYTLTLRARWNAHRAADFETTFTTAAAGRRAAALPRPLAFTGGF